jgi:prepilin-type N-terminal cleavage/methylation domain-containing protein
MRISRGGFTLTELMIYVVIGGVIMGATYRVMITQSRAFGKQREVLDTRETERSAAALLAWDLRHAASGGGQLVAMNANNLTLRSLQGVGVVCAKHALLPRIALWSTAGAFQATPDDSLLVYEIGRDSTKWHALKVYQVGTPVAMGMAACGWPGARSPDVVVQVSLTNHQDSLVWRSTFVGAPVRSFRVTAYGEFSLNGRWWLGRKVGAAAYEQLTGPLLTPSSGGVGFTYYDTLGAVTANPAAVGTVGVTLRAQSFKQASFAGAVAYQQDSLTTRVALRR